MTTTSITSSLKEVILKKSLRIRERATEVKIKQSSKDKRW